MFREKTQRQKSLKKRRSIHETKNIDIEEDFDLDLPIKRILDDNLDKNFSKDYLQHYFKLRVYESNSYK